MLTAHLAFDKQNLKLYATISQVFSIFVIPFYRAPVTLTTVLDLERKIPDEKSNSPTVPLHNRRRASSSEAGDGGGDSNDGEPAPLYYIASQEDFYQTSEWIKFLLPYGIGVSIATAWQAFATLFCILATFVLWPIVWLEENRYLPLSGGAQLTG